MARIAVTHAYGTNGKTSGKAKGVNRVIGARYALNEAFAEDGEPRKTKTRNYDPSRTPENITYYRNPEWHSGKDIYRAVNKELKEWRDPLGRKARIDKKYINFDIITPDGEIMAHLSKQEQVNLLLSCYEVLAKIDPEYYDENMLAITIQFDEGVPHMHCVNTTRHGEEWSATAFEPLNLYAHKIGENFPRMLREYIWDNQDLFTDENVEYLINNIEDYDVYNRERGENDPEYRSQRREKHSYHGMSANMYAAVQEKKKAQTELKAARKELRKLQDEFAVMKDNYVDPAIIRETTEEMERLTGKVDSQRQELEKKNKEIQNLSNHIKKQSENLQRATKDARDKNTTAEFLAKNCLRELKEAAKPTTLKDALYLAELYEAARSVKPKIAQQWNNTYHDKLPAVYKVLDEWQTSLMERMGKPESAKSLQDDEIGVFLRIRELRKKWNRQANKSWNSGKTNGVKNYKYLQEINKLNLERELKWEIKAGELDQQETQEQPEPQGMMARQKDLNERLAISEEKRNQALGKMAATRQRMEQSRKMDYSRSNDGMEF